MSMDFTVEYYETVTGRCPVREFLDELEGSVRTTLRRSSLVWRSCATGTITVSHCLTRIIHERFCCNRGFAAATSQHAASRACWQADSPLGRSTDCFKSASLPRGSARPSRLATARFRDEPS
jgi:hypothetical protein